ncbi:unnamed protein product [Clonostachys rosea]|uniref:Protein kinase domain-containing protein n=1 Tax=Bionectria ochroleuca TaxID=29856 RepID=A0ABY6UBU0_BIOOC|nr:unnamed protein product [Clonostachys rosea]
MEILPQLSPITRVHLERHMKNSDGHSNISRRFLPSSSIAELTTADKVFFTLRSLELKGEELDKLVDFVRNGAEKIFLCLVLIQRLKYLADFMKTKFTDKYLPIPETINAEGNTTNSQEELIYETPPDIERPAKNLLLQASLGETYIQFYENQWCFLSPCFNFSETLQTRAFHPNRPLAYLLSSLSSSPTYTSNSSASIFIPIISYIRSCQFSSSTKDSSQRIEVALKIMIAQGYHDDVGIIRHKFLVRETQTLERMTTINHDHLIHTLAAYQSGKDMCFVFPWARGGNLNEFWNSFGKLQHNMDFVAWSLDQMRGITDGLIQLHNQHIRHGDIKPNNILHFTQAGPGSAPGRLVIADVGLAKYEDDDDEDRSKYTSTTQCTILYRSPNWYGIQPSRLEDFWSLSCIFLEFTIWIIDGNLGLSKFRKDLGESQRTLSRDMEPKFWYWDRDWKRNQMPKLDPVVEKMMDKMQQINSPMSQLAKELIMLIRTRLLNIDFHQLHMGLRQISREILNQLTELSNRYRNNGKNAQELSLATHKAGSYQMQDSTVQQRNTFSGGVTLDWPSLRPGVQSSASWCMRKLKKKLFRATCDIKICQQCRSNLCRDIQELERGSHECALCQLFIQSTTDANLKSGEPVTLFRDNESHIVRLPGQDSPVISLYSEPEFLKESLSAPPPGLPLLPKMGSPQQNKLLNAWINLCNETHDCSSDTENMSALSRQMPTRLVSVGDDETSIIRLVDSMELSEDKFVALSYRWGGLSNIEMACTTVSNIDNYKKEIQFESLPQTFRDAIKLARAIGVPFLWIDALCIIQGDEGDWEREAARMEEVFSSAYCVFAATSAKSPLEGFLGDREPRPSIAVRTSRGAMYLSKYIDDFEKDVECGPLNSRGWVFQERALARRTVHITSAQIYWECGKGVYCEILAQLENPRSKVLGDAHFPESSFRSYKYKDERVRLLQYLQELYSSLSLGNLTDRPKAMLGMEKRTARVLKSQARYGIYGAFFARTILWEATVSGGLKRIDPMGGKRVPS